MTPSTSGGLRGIIIIIIIFLVGRRAPNRTATASNESVTTSKI